MTVVKHLTSLLEQIVTDRTSYEIELGIIKTSEEKTAEVVALKKALNRRIKNLRGEGIKLALDMRNLGIEDSVISKAVDSGRKIKL